MGTVGCPPDPGGGERWDEFIATGIESSSQQARWGKLSGKIGRGGDGQGPQR